MSAKADNLGDGDPAPPRLSVRGLVCRRGERDLFAPVTFSLAAGGIVWLRGANGQGKTTLLRTLAGLGTAAAGAVEWASGAAAGKFLFLGHANALKDDLAAGEALRFLLELDATAGAPESDDGTVGAALAALAMRERRHMPVRTLSQGQRRRVALSRLAVDRGPCVWLLDEPFDALDAAGIDAVNRLLVAHAARGGSAVLTSHVPLSLPPSAAIDEVALESR